MKKDTIRIGGMACTTCSGIVEKSLNKVEGIQTASVSLEKETADIEYDPDVIGLVEIHKIIEDAGYQVID